ncbi:YkvI family membrane protein [Sphingomonas oryzagri]
MADAEPVRPGVPATWFQRFLLPGFAFKAVVIGGGYATGLELAEFFLPAGPWGGLAAIAVATLLWSLVCAATFALAVATKSYDYRSFFRVIIGRGWVLFEIVYVLFVILIISVYGAAAGAIGKALFGWPSIVGTLLLAGGIAGFATFGNHAVERLFKWVSIALYLVYALFLLLALTRFGPMIAAQFARPAVASPFWLAGGVTYASYNVVGAVAILPMLRHIVRPRDAVIAGLVAGPLAIVPAIIFFVVMIAFYPAIVSAPLPSDTILSALDIPVFHLAFQTMIFLALLESGTGAVHAINERIAASVRHPLTRGIRLAMTAAMLLLCISAAERFGLVTLIARGYRLLAIAIVSIFLLPLLAALVRTIIVRSRETRLI